jgi:ATPase subunit of ABC transporter with duplicated ATPase domains
VLTVTGLGDGAWRPFAAPAPAGRAARPADAGGGSPPPLDSLIVRGPEHLALTGPNGAGKTTLLRIITGELAAGGPGGTRLNGALLNGTGLGGTGLGGTGLGGTGLGGTGLTVRCPVPAGYLPQRLDVLDDSLSVARNARRTAPSASVNEVRAGLARFLFRGSRADQLAGSLSGGERFRAVLACLLLATPPPQLLLLDEPTNSLDRASTRQLAEALACYQGALIIVSHDLPFLRSVGITRWLWLDGRGQLTEAEPL